MYCLECGKLINRTINYTNIFKKERHFICEYCFRNYLFLYEVDVLPIDNHLLFLNVLLDNYKDSNAFMSFLKPYYIYYLKNNLKSIIMYFDVFNDKIYNIINILNLDDLFIITLKKQLKGGIKNDY